jgi:probable HAF family extracellular repeat protein
MFRISLPSYLVSTALIVCVSLAFVSVPVRADSGSITNLGTLGGSTATANGISGDGSTVVGASELTGDSTSHAFSWTRVGSMANLGTFGGASSFAYMLPPAELSSLAIHT